jgi:polyisoprenoid-binding protein YceI
MMAIPRGTYSFDPGNASLKVFTRKAGAASKAGHNLEIEVGAWEARLTTGDGLEAEMTLSADSRSLRVLAGTGGVKALTRDDKANIEQTIDEEVLGGCAIEFRSNSVAGTPTELAVQGELELAGQRQPLAFAVNVDSRGRVSAHATVKQTAWGIEPYSALFGTLKVIDDVEIVLAGTLPSDEVPERTLPSEEVPEGTLPSEEVPEGTLPSDEVPADTLPTG